MTEEFLKPCGCGQQAYRYIYTDNLESMEYKYPFGEIVKPLVQKDRTAKQVFVLGVYASAVHAKWKKGNEIVCQALAVTSEPRIFWDGNPDEAKEIISKIHIPDEFGTLEPSGSHLNGPSAKVSQICTTPTALLKKNQEYFD